MNISKITKGDLYVEPKTIARHFGTHNGNVIIAETGIFFLHGKLFGNVYVSNNSKYLLHGTHNGEIDNNGEIIVYGVLNSKKKVTGNVDFTPEAIINIID